MITNPERFKHNRSAYERPEFKYRCGREAKWGKPCHQGPTPAGTCGGISECTPIQNEKGRFECRRPKAVGGPCTEGPLPDGSCSKKHPPCVPRMTLRSRRERLAFIWFTLVISMILGLLLLSRASSEAFSPIYPGPLSEKHANFSADKGCVSCHAVHELGPAAWLKQIFVKNDLSAQCLTCHELGGLESKPHNMMFPERTDLADTSCVKCHTEHKGRTFDIRAMSDKQCNACHQTQFKSFAAGHPEFSEQFPHEDRTGIEFDHDTHFNKYFTQSSTADKAPQGCLSCHDVESASTMHVTTGSFDQNCASCHGTEIAKASLVLFRSPELYEDTIDRKAMLDVCGPYLKGSSGAAVAPGESYESISIDEPSILSSYLLGVPQDDPDAYGAPMQNLMFEMASGDVSALSALMKHHVADERLSKELLRGLDPLMLKEAACAWLANQEFESRGSSSSSGWKADLLELKYQPMGHADSVAKRWIEAGLQIYQDAMGTELEEKADDVRAHLLSKKRGVGRCVKCHSVSARHGENGAKQLGVAWSHNEPEQRQFTFYSHGAHLHLLGGGSDACKTCHVLDSEARYADSFESYDASQFASNFKSIKKETCLMCHGATQIQPALGQVRQDCLLCHTYHRHPMLKKSVLGKSVSENGASKKSEDAENTL